MLAVRSVVDDAQRSPQRQRQADGKGRRPQAELLSKCAEGDRQDQAGKDQRGEQGDALHVRFPIEQTCRAQIVNMARAKNGAQPREVMVFSLNSVTELQTGIRDDCAALIERTGLVGHHYVVPGWNVTS